MKLKYESTLKIRLSLVSRQNRDTNDYRYKNISTWKLSMRLQLRF